MSDVDLRHQRFWDLLDFSSGLGLEVGPLNRPIVTREQADVRYVDVHDAAGLADTYADDPTVHLDEIPEIDYVLVRDGVTRTLGEATGSGGPFDWALASHVIEHVPDVIGWLDDLATVVVDDGALVLAVPDKRYCFDILRPETTVGQLLAAHLRADRTPSVRAVYDYFSMAVGADTAGIWRGEAPGTQNRIHGPEVGAAMASRAASGEYVDCHAWVFTPSSFLAQLHELRRIGHCHWYVDRMDTTAANHLEFFVRLRRVPRDVVQTAELDEEVLTTQVRPEWVDVEALEHRVRHLATKLERREEQLEKWRRRARNQRRRADRLAAERLADVGGRTDWIRRVWGRLDPRADRPGGRG